MSLLIFNEIQQHCNDIVLFSNPQFASPEMEFNTVNINSAYLLEISHAGTLRILENVRSNRS